MIGLKDFIKLCVKAVCIFVVMVILALLSTQLYILIHECGHVLGGQYTGAHNVGIYLDMVNMCGYVMAYGGQLFWIYIGPFLVCTLFSLILLSFNDWKARWMALVFAAGTMLNMLQFNMINVQVATLGNFTSDAAVLCMNGYWYVVVLLFIISFGLGLVAAYKMIEELFAKKD